MSAVLVELVEEVVELSPENKIIFDLISEIRKESAADRLVIHADIKKINEKLDTHIGYQCGVNVKEKSTVLEIVRSLVSLFKEQPLILVILSGLILLVSADTLTSLRSFFPW